MESLKTISQLSIVFLSDWEYCGFCASTCNVVVLSLSSFYILPTLIVFMGYKNVMVSTSGLIQKHNLYFMIDSWMYWLACHHYTLMVGVNWLLFFIHFKKHGFCSKLLKNKIRSLTKFSTLLMFWLIILFTC